MPLRAFAAAVALGALPKTVAYVALGGALSAPFSTRGAGRDRALRGDRDRRRMACPAARSGRPLSTTDASLTPPTPWPCNGTIVVPYWRSWTCRPYVENLRRELAVAADAGGEEARALAERLTAPLESAVRLMLLDALSAAADEITRELAPGSVELRLRARRAGVRRHARHRPTSRRASVPDAARAAGGRRGRDGAHQPAPARAAQGRHRAGRRPRAAVGQRLARPRRGRRARRTTTRGRASAAAGSASASPAGCADRPRPPTHP